jgi:HAD superfamily 5'-nucleotidase-like hydrolase
LVAQQLPLPFQEIAPLPELHRIPRSRRVFVNRNLRMSGIDWVGFDMDYTLAIYDQPEMDALSIQATVQKLVLRGYPAWLADVPYDTQFAIRGLLIDKRHGNVLKMDRYKLAHVAYHGYHRLSREQVVALYHQTKIRPATPRWHWIDTLYALSEATLYAGIIDAMERRKHTLDYVRLFADIRESIDEAHRDGTILDAVLGQLPRFIVRDPELPATLHKLRSAGKKLFLLTNSRWPYTERMMTHLLGSAAPEYPSWRHFFEVVIVAAQKPAFFQQRRPIEERDGAILRPVTGPLERGRVYEGGNLQDLERQLGVTGDRILYVGDHIYGDILRSKKESAWRTAMIIQEMEAEVAAHDACADELARVDQLEDRRGKLEDELRWWQGRFKDLSRQIEAAEKRGGRPPSADVEAERLRVKRSVDRLRALLREVDHESDQLQRRVHRQFHRYWGSLLKEQNEKSSFGAQVEEYACLYTSRVSNLQLYSPQQYFRSPRELMPHEL